MTESEQSVYLHTAFESLKGEGNTSAIIQTELLFSFLNGIGLYLPNAQVLQIIKETKRKDFQHLNFSEFETVIKKVSVTKPKNTLQVILNAYVIILLILEFILAFIYVQGKSSIMLYAVLGLGGLLVCSIIYVVVLPIFFNRANSKTSDSLAMRKGETVDGIKRANIFLDRK
jgi:hypothetical protein